MPTDNSSLMENSQMFLASIYLDFNLWFEFGALESENLYRQELSSEMKW